MAMKQKLNLKTIDEFVKGEVFKPKPYIRDNKYIINLPDEIKENLEKGIAVLRTVKKHRR